jgi:hypothetical protein
MPAVKSLLQVNFQEKTTFRVRCYYIYLVHAYSHGGGGGVGTEPERRLEGQQFTKLVENTNMTVAVYLQYLNSDKHLPHSPFIDQFFSMTTFC